MCKVINFEERKAMLEQKKIEEQCQNDLADFFNMLHSINSDELAERLLSQNIPFEELGNNEMQVITIDLGETEEKTPEEVDAEIRRILDGDEESLYGEPLVKFNEEINPERIAALFKGHEKELNDLAKKIFNDYAEKIDPEEKPNTADEITNHFIENGDARDLVIQVEKESFTSVIVIKYEEIKKKLLDTYGFLISDTYLAKNLPTQFLILMDLCRIRDISYEDLSDDEQMAFSYIIIQLRNDFC